jgi:hypothetical protein
MSSRERTTANKMTKNSTVAPISSTTIKSFEPTEHPMLASKEANVALSSPSSSLLSEEQQLVDPNLMVGVRKSDIFPIVEVNLSRAQDQSKQKRVQLAQQVASTLHRSLSTNFHGGESNSKFILLARIVTVSDGNSTARFFFNKQLADSGHAKLGVSYCLFSRETGKVAFSKRTTTLRSTTDEDSSSKNAGVKEPWFGRDNGTQLVMGMADKCAKEIPREVMASIQQHPMPRRTTYD